MLILKLLFDLIRKYTPVIKNNTLGTNILNGMSVKLKADTIISIRPNSNDGTFMISVIL